MKAEPTAATAHAGAERAGAPGARLAAAVDRLLPRTLSSRVTLVTLAIFICALWAMTFLVGRMLRHDMEQLLGEQQSSAASLLAGDIQEAVDERLRPWSASPRRSGQRT
jgi:hypothetical protein